jgi:Uma2 family endonuclease
MSKMGLPVRKQDAHYTYKDYRQWPDDERWELIDGVAYNMCVAPRLKHQDVGGEIYSALRTHLKGKPCKAFIAPTDVFLPRVNEMNEDDVDTVVQPDVLVVCDRAKIRGNGIWGAPDLVVEVLSPSTSRKDLREKFDLYQRCGVREYWVIDVNAPWLQQYVLGEDGLFGVEVTLEKTGVLASAVLPDFHLDVEDLWPVDLP